MKRLSFMVQSLDNVMPGAMVADGKPLSPDDKVARRELAAKIGLEMMKAKEIFSENGVSTHLTGNLFFLRVQTDQKDDLGRRAPILAMGELPQHLTGECIDDILTDLMEFALTVDRTIGSSGTESIRQALESIEESRDRKKKALRNLVAFLFLLVTLFTVIWALYGR